MVRRKEIIHSLTPDVPSKEYQFIADAMLGRLARWLRFLGFDTLYYPDITDNDLIRIAREQNRCILTRDTRLVKIKGLKDYVLISSNDSFQQLLELKEKLELKQFNLFSRCVACNGHLVKISDKSEIKDTIPEFVFLNYDLFTKCENCGRIFWEGSHPKKFKEKINRIIQISTGDLT
jgi:uncharacterized protein with PIN domain